MPRISLTDFVDIVSAAGTHKATKVRTIQNRDDYHPAFDFYKNLRDRIIDVHAKGLPKTALDNAHELTNDTKKIGSYLNIANCYQKWWGKKKFEWFTPDHGIYEQHGISVSVNPEIGLNYNGESHLIKLYFKKDPLTKSKIDIITHIMASTLNTAKNGHIASVLDIQNKKLISPTVPIADLDKTLKAELAYISSYLE